MKSTALRLTMFLAAVGLVTAPAAAVRAEDTDPAALGAGLKEATTTLQGGLKASEREGTPISAKFEIEDGKLQLSVYTMKGDDFMEIVADPKTGAAKAEELTDAVDLNDAAAQKAAMLKAKVTLLTAVDRAVKANPGFQAVSVYPQLQNSDAVAEVALLQGKTLKKVTEKLD
jgi:hypothetical protein